MKPYAIRLAVATLLWCIPSIFAQPQKGIDPNVVVAWKSAEANLGWCQVDRNGNWRLYSQAPEGAALPLFHVIALRNARFAELPAPSVPFGLVIDNKQANDSILKEFPAFDKLQVLILAQTM